MEIQYHDPATSDDIIQNLTVSGTDISIVNIRSSMELASYDNNERKSIRVRSDKDIVLYGLSKETFSSDAFLCYPISALDTSYVICSYANDIPDGNFDSPANRYGSVAVVGVEDNTTVLVQPSAPLRGREAQGLQAMTFTIGRGETRMIGMSPQGVYDVSGTIVRADKNIAVFSAHERASIPASDGSTDALIEQTPPVSMLGYSAIFTPHSSPEPTLQTLARVVAPFDETVVQSNGSSWQIDSGDTLEWLFTTAFQVRSDKPLLCAQYELTSSLSSSLRRGDPFMAFIPAPEQYLTAYTFVNIGAAGYSANYINISIPKVSAGSVVLDGVPVNTAEFQDVPGSEYAWASIPVDAGFSHSIKADTGFGLLVYGYSLAESYGYTGGLKTERRDHIFLDVDPPTTAFDSDCNLATLYIDEDRNFDSGIDSIALQYTINVSLEIPTFTRGDKSLSIPLELIDPFEDGLVVVTAYDRAGHIREDSIFVKGLTLEMTAGAGFAEGLFMGSLQCDTVTVRNYGRFDQYVSALLVKTVDFAIPASWRTARIPAGESLRIPVCFEGRQLGDIADTVLLRDSCGREVHHTLQSRVLPGVFAGLSECEVLLTAAMPPDAQSAYAVFFEASTLHIDYLDHSSTMGLLRVFDISGAEVFRAGAKGSDRFDLQNLANGVYVFSFETGDAILKGQFVITR